MKLSALAYKNGIDTFTAADFEFVSAKVSQDPERLILVGGQAIEIWARFLDVPSPIGNGSPLTEDTDWLGGKRDAQWLCERLGPKDDVELNFADDFGSSPNSAQAYLRRAGRILMMDFLRSIVGPDTEMIRKLAVEVQVRDAKILVMHPLLCLESRFANLEVIPAKRKGNGPMQAEWTIKITQAFLRRMVAENLDKDELAKACRRIAELAEHTYGKYCLLHFGLDALSAIPEDVVSHIGGRFETEEWPRSKERIKKKQARLKEIASRSVQQVRGSGHFPATGNLPSNGQSEE